MKHRFLTADQAIGVLAQDIRHALSEMTYLTPAQRHRRKLEAIEASTLALRQSSICLRSGAKLYRMDDGSTHVPSHVDVSATPFMLAGYAQDGSDVSFYVNAFATRTA